MNKKERARRIKRVEEKAAILFLLYEQMGPTRSLEALADLCTKLALKAALRTLKGYSVKFNWQRQLLERSVKRREEQEQEVLNQVDKMNADHIRVHQGLMGLAIAGINYYQELLERKRAAGQHQSINFAPADIVRMIRQAQIGERLARGQATSRSEIMVELIGTFVQEFALIFKQINLIVDPVEREREYIKLFDERLHEFYSNVTDRSIKKITEGFSR
jgi:hypothetical protein